MNRRFALGSIVLLITLTGAALAAWGLTQDNPLAYPIQKTPQTGGAGTVSQSDTNAFSRPQGNLPMTKRLDFSVGNSFFRNPWVEAPSSTAARDGLGPLFNTNSCQGCHIKDGRGHPPGVDRPSVSLFLRLAVPADPGKDAAVLRQHGFKPAPVYGKQLQTSAISGAKPEADLELDWEPMTQTLAGGSTVTLQKPHYRIENPNYGPLPDDLLISPRVAPPMIGLGLLEALPDEAISQTADPGDSDGDGISGRVNRVWDMVKRETVPGRFGWKASEPSVRQQAASAFAGDMGLTSSIAPETDCSEAQKCDAFPTGGSPEVSDKIMDFIDFYARSLAVPARRNMSDPAVKKGAHLFNDSGCAACHTPHFTTGTLDGRPDLSNQSIWPYTDLLLHDMGPALADGRNEYLADGNEWRTAPLWGIGMAQEVNALAGFLHDGRARTIEEAILWHGGEAKSAAEHYRNLTKDERQAMIRFLTSL